MVVALSVVNGLISAISFPAMASITPQLVPRDELQQANALMSLVRSALTIVGPSLAALLVVTVGPGWALMADAITWLLAALVMLGVRIPARGPKSAEAPGALADLRAGWTFFRTTTWLWVVVLAFGFLNAIHVGALLTLGPVVAKDTIGEQGWGLVLSAEAVGLLAMTLVLLRVRLGRPLLFGMLGISLLGVPLVLLGVEPHLGLLLVVMFVAGAGQEVFGIGWNVAMQENIDEEMLSRAYSYDALGSWVAMPIGQLAYGPLAEAFGYEEMLVGSGVAYVAICLLTLLSRSVRNLPRRPTEMQAGAEPSDRPAA
jgi:MFS family permease